MISLGIDIGGTGCKCVAFHQDGRQLAISYAEYPLTPGQVNLPPDILTDSVYSVISGCTGQLEHPEEIAAITISSFGESFVAVDDGGQALTDILLYFGNSESEEFSRLVSEIGQEKFMEIARRILLAVQNALYKEDCPASCLEISLHCGIYLLETDGKSLCGCIVSLPESSV